MYFPSLKVLRFLFFFLPGAAIILVVVLYAVMAQALRTAVTQSIDQNAHVAGNVSLELPFFQWTGQQLLSGLALDDDFTPETYALLQARPYLDRIASSRDVEAICQNVLNLSRAA